MPLTLLPFLLLAVPIVEIAVFIAIGGEIGIAMTLALVFVTAIIGTILLRVQGFAVLNRIRREVEADRLPGRDLGHGVMILVAGVLLLTPGFVTDAIGFALFVPAIRSALWRAVASRMIVVNLSRNGERQPYDDRVVDLDPDEFENNPNPDTPWRTDGRRN